MTEYVIRFFVGGVSSRHSRSWGIFYKTFAGLFREGWLIDSGQRRWSQRTRRYEIVWASTVFGKTLQ
jgi:hypothetical protein